MILPHVLSNGSAKSLTPAMRQRGFSLVEIALVLVIVGLALGAGITVLNLKLAQAKIDNTKVKTEAVRVALINFVGQNFRMPCPADPLAVRGAANYNVERRNAVPIGGETCIASAALINNIGGTALTGVSRGVVPCTTLGFPEDACVDGWGVRLTYFVQNNAIRLTRDTVSGMRGSMTVHTVVPPAAVTTTAGLAPTGNQINACSTTPNDNSCNLAAVAMIISHGANRGGGFVPTSGVVLPQVVGTNISAYEAENTNNNIQFIQNDFVETLPNSFDDILVAVVPRDIVSTLNQTGIVKQPNVFMNERFAQIKIAILNQIFSPSPLPSQGTTPDRGFRFALGSVPVALAQVFPASINTANCPNVIQDTLQLPLVADVQALTVASGLRIDAWGNPIRYKLFATNGVSKPGICVAVGPPNAHVCAPVPNPTKRSGECQTAFVLVSYGPNGVANTGVAGDDDIFYPVSHQDASDIVLKSGGW